MSNWTRGNNPFDVILGEYQVRNILEHAKGGALLDLGCNDGRMLYKLMEDGLFTIGRGVDADSLMVDRARGTPVGFRGPYDTTDKDITIACSPIEEFECHEMFDTIILINVLEHVDDPVLVLKLARARLKRGGVIIVHVPNREGLNRRLGMKMGLISSYTQLSEKDIEVGHKRFFDRVLLGAMIEQAGLKVDKLGGVLLKPFSNAQMQRIADEWEGGKEIFDGLYELAREMPEYSSPIWTVCSHG